MKRIIEISNIDTEHIMLWNNYVLKKKKCRYSDFIQWKIIYRKLYNIRSYHIMCLEESRVSGVVSLFQNRRVMPFSKPYSVSSPLSLSGAGGIHFDDDETKHKLMEYIAGHPELKNHVFIGLQSVENLNMEKQFVSRYADYVIPIDYRTVMRKKIDSDERWSLNKARRNKLSFTLDDSMDNFFQMLHISMRRHGTPWHGKRFYGLIQKYFRNKIRYVGVKLKDATIAGAMLFQYRDSLAVVHAGSIKKYWPLRCNDYLYWSIIEYCYRNNIKNIDLGRSLLFSSQEKFKTKWGAVPHPIYYSFLNNDSYGKDIYLNNCFYKTATSIWKYFPVCATRNIGKYFIRYLV